jgi:hypothetical protein
MICSLDESITKQVINPVKPIIEPNKGYSITRSIAGFSDKVIDAGWCKVLHHSTDIFIIGMLTEPTKTRIDKNLSAFSLLLKES